MTLSKTPSANRFQLRLIVLGCFALGLFLFPRTFGCSHSVLPEASQEATVERTQEPPQMMESGPEVSAEKAPTQEPSTDRGDAPESTPEPESTQEKLPAHGNDGPVQENEGPELPQPERTGPSVDWASLQWPPVLTTSPNQATATIYGQVYVKGITDSGNSHPAPSIQAQLGYGSIDKDPAKFPGAWTWSSNVTFHKRSGLNNNNYEFQGKLQIATPGWYRYTYRYAINNGPWKLGDRNDYNRKGSSDGASLEEMGTLVVVKPGSQVKIVSYNLHCQVEQPQTRMKEIAKLLAQLQPDIVALQEVCKAQTSGSTNTAEQLRVLLQQQSVTGYKAFFSTTHTATHDGQSFQEGLGLLSRLPTLEQGETELPPQGQRPTGAFPRKVLWVRAASPVGILSFASTHLSFRREHEAWRVQQVEALKQWLSDSQRQAHLTLVGGDFNASPDSTPVMAILTPNQPAQTPGYLDAMKSLDAGFTFPATNLSIRIDYLFLYQASNVSPQVKPLSGQRIFTKPVNGLYLSDHVGILATFESP